jgi:hypothetical protein
MHTHHLRPFPHTLLQYGNKLFQSAFIAALFPDASIYVRMQWTLLNSAVALVGYYCSAYTVSPAVCGAPRAKLCVVCAPAAGRLPPGHQLASQEAAATPAALGDLPFP